MKKILGVLVLGLIFAPSAHAAFDTDLRYGSSGAPVLELQEFLTAQGVYTGPISGNFYSLTLAGVKALQAKLNVSPQSGFFGPLTRANANTILSADLKESDVEASSTPVVVVPTTIQTTAPQTVTQVAAPVAAAAPFEAYEVRYEQPRTHTVYVWMNKEVASISVPGYTFTKTYEVVDIQNSCIYAGEQKRCGGDVYRFAPDQPLAEGTFPITIRSVGGEVVSGTITSSGPDY